MVGIPNASIPDASIPNEDSDADEERAGWREQKGTTKRGRGGEKEMVGKG